MNRRVEKIVNQLNKIADEQFAAGYDEGMKQSYEVSRQMIDERMDKINRNLLDQVYEIHGRGKEYRVAKECLDAMRIDVLAFFDESKETINVILQMG